jgi:Phage integrase family
MRAAVGPRDATILSLLAYAGLRPQEARRLCWADVRERTLLVQAPKTRRTRTVGLLSPLAADLADWRRRAGGPPPDAPVFPGSEGAAWTAEGFNQWRQRTFRTALEGAGVAAARPYHLRHSFASLLLHEGRSVIYMARQLGHGAELTCARTATSLTNSRTRRGCPPRRRFVTARRAVQDQSWYPSRTSPARRQHARGTKRLQPANAPSRSRTCGLLLRRESLYPAELSGRREASVPVCSPAVAPWEGRRHWREHGCDRLTGRFAGGRESKMGRRRIFVPQGELSAGACS